MQRMSRGRRSSAGPSDSHHPRFLHQPCDAPFGILNTAPGRVAAHGSDKIVARQQ